ncbi:MAG: hypothetical protein QGG74_01460 [Phycisphaerales bacterium]|nr:hypothetical protein [Phycisphaerales bacterium]
MIAQSRTVVALALASVVGGCSGIRGPEVLTIEPQQYQEAFSTAVELVRDRGWEPEFMDRRSGVIESGPTQSGSLIDPWRLNTMDMETVVENTLSKTRTRVRVEFRPIHAGGLAHSERDDLRRPDYLGAAETTDLTTAAEPLDLRVWVFVEHGHAPNVMRSTWSPTLSARPRRAGHDRNWESPPAGAVWIPTSRDRNAERRLLWAIQEALQTNQPVQADPPPSAS